MKHLAVVALIALTMAPACTTRSEPQKDLLKFLTATQDSSRSFVYEDKTKSGGNVVVTGEFQDDLRMHAKVSIDGSDVLEETLSEDAMAVRIFDASKVPALQFGTVGGSQIVGDALRSGRWVLDYRGAPPLIAPKTKTNAILVGANPVLDSLYIFQYLRKTVEEAALVQVFNKDAIEYNAKEDPFPPSDRGAGLQRYDLVAPPLPLKSAEGTEGASPGTSHFRRMAFYIKGQRLVEVRERIDFESHKDFLRARQGRGPRHPLTFLKALREGKGREPIRVRDMSYRLGRIGDANVKVALPTSDFLAADLAGIFGPTGINQAAPANASTPTEPAATGTATPTP
ncbi:MAG: hypothetical protein ABIS18_11525 [Actinomycetota bacterium]